MIRAMLGMVPFRPDTEETLKQGRSMDAKIVGSDTARNPPGFSKQTPSISALWRRSFRSAHWAPAALCSNPICPGGVIRHRGKRKASLMALLCSQWLVALPCGLLHGSRSAALCSPWISPKFRNQRTYLRLPIACRGWCCHCYSGVRGGTPLPGKSCRVVRRPTAWICSVVGQTAAEGYLRRRLDSNHPSQNGRAAASLTEAKLRPSRFSRQTCPHCLC
ncbi:hypothetical protein B0T16DRAFT_228284 [Cercophora newfieldiana]|uniref:Uncharacterized protein n=1 Tax=Cercophora newfieldiana TaxID=92897 RepID=A0AA40CHN9_9PEZI|nr:hypothetical protein B0T16DRAFT_228284 [Cercophora newfieldiana]